MSKTNSENRKHETKWKTRRDEVRWDCDKGVMPDFSFPLWCPGDPSLSSDFSDSASNHFPAPAEPPRDDSFHHIHHKDTWEGLSPCGATVHLPEYKYIGKEGFTARTNRWGGNWTQKGCETCLHVCVCFREWRWCLFVKGMLWAGWFDVIIYSCDSGLAEEAVLVIHQVLIDTGPGEKRQKATRNEWDQGHWKLKKLNNKKKNNTVN